MLPSAVSQRLCPSSAVTPVLAAQFLAGGDQPAEAT
jgi:hypothetical protein